jgi:hypothetical protein
MGSASANIRIDVTARDILQSGVTQDASVRRFIQSLDLNNGTADGYIDLIYGVSASAIAASTTTSYDLVGTLTSLGVTLNFSEIVFIIVHNKRTTALAYLIVGAHATNGFGKLVSSLGFWGATADVTNGGGSVVAPNSWMILYNKQGVPCSAGATDILAVVTSGVAGSTNEFDIIIGGRSA